MKKETNPTDPEDETRNAPPEEPEAPPETPPVDPFGRKPVPEEIRQSVIASLRHLRVADQVPPNEVLAKESSEARRLSLDRPTP